MVAALGSSPLLDAMATASRLDADELNMLVGVAVASPRLRSIGIHQGMDG
uniref:Uncharacterized protein n=1 Tax=Arundo donax TaxID=35708 RepID=A0A0A8Y9U6_ARUDO